VGTLLYSSLAESAIAHLAAISGGVCCASGGRWCLASTPVGQLLLFFLTVVLVLFALRLVFYGDHRQWNAIDGIAVVLGGPGGWCHFVDYGTERFPASAIIASIHCRSQSAVSLRGSYCHCLCDRVFLILAIVFSGVSLFFKSCFGWLERVENVMHFLLIF